MINVGSLLSGVLGLTIAGALAVALILAPVDAGAAYWLSVLWVLILIIGNWLSSVAIFKSKRAGDEPAGSIFGVLPAISGAFLLYSCVSCAALVGYHMEFLGFRSHAVVQILGIASVGTLVLTSLTAPQLANNGMDVAVRQSDLLLILERWRRGCQSEPALTRAIDELADYIKYRMPHVAKLDQEALLYVLEYSKSINKPDMNIIREVASRISSA